MNGCVLFHVASVTTTPEAISKSSTMLQGPGFIFSHHTSVAAFAVPKAAYLAARKNASFGYIATSTLVMDTSIASSPRILLLQRAASDEDANKWEPPGGACDDDDETILHAAARELWEEAGLQATHIGGQVGDPYFFTLDDGKKVCQFNFAVSLSADSVISSGVKLNPEEHQRFVWATESEVKARKADGVDLDFTRREVELTVLLAFDHFRAK
ncbi:NUDIX hydrolase domain-like protein [Stachybotrys elegans]|uniref:NUDIX hydrolase domain-like protein n=1 Tax=Stachybotrys elegans TaxID=80388 RepID=A0A8K0SFV1_9HYPO|nr:NUDIX hydrolase domain-like protein [Stachybotrys elegans]